MHFSAELSLSPTRIEIEKQKEEERKKEKLKQREETQKQTENLTNLMGKISLKDHKNVISPKAKVFQVPWFDDDDEEKESGVVGGGEESLTSEMQTQQAEMQKQQLVEKDEIGKCVESTLQATVSPFIPFQFDYEFQFEF